jgi:cell wall-associated NlpC family hydrolase
VLNGRNRIITASAAVVIAAIVGSIPGSPAEAKPSIKDTAARVDALYHQAEQASERYNAAKVQVASLQKAVGALKADQARQDKIVAAARRDVQDNIVRQYEGQSLSAVGQIVVSPDPSAFVSQLTTMSAFDDFQSKLYTDYQTQLKALDIRREATQKQLDKVAALKASLAKDKATIDGKFAAAKAVLSKLKADQRVAVVASRSSVVRSTPTVTTSAPASGRAAIAVRYAMAQVGKPYVYGAAGPSAYDCSGLTMAAWGSAGVGLPHSSSAQYGSGTHVSPSALQPGDLVFYYSPISHVGMYIGNGMIVNAENPSAGIKVTGLYSMPFVGAVRPG